MVNGESTEDIECAGYGRVRNIDEARIRGGVLLVIGEGLCLKAPKVQRHTERLKVPGGTLFAFQTKEKKSLVKVKAAALNALKFPMIFKFMKDIIAEDQSLVLLWSPEDSALDTEELAPLDLLLVLAMRLYVCHGRLHRSWNTNEN